MLERARGYLRRFRAGHRPRSVVLVYHSIAAVPSDPWEIHIPPARFAEQLEAVRREFRPVALEDLAASVRSGSIPRSAVAVTFDDGYANNLTEAVPLLERHSIPATVFVTSGFVDRDEECWWDTLERIVLGAHRAPSEVRLHINGNSLQWEMDGPEDIGSPVIHSWRAWEPPPGRRQAAYIQIWECLLSLDEDVRRAALASLAAQMGTFPVPRPSHRLLTGEELQRLARSPAIDVGAHTVLHPVLARIPLARQQAEVAGSRVALEARIGGPVRSFAYPYGQPAHISGETVRVVRDAGFSCACVNTPGTVDSRSDVLRLPRLHVRNWDGDELIRQVRRCLER